MKKVLSFGSLNLDSVYTVPHFVRAGETMSATAMETHCGGKGLNQSIALARAGVTVYHAGAVGPDGGCLLDALQKSGVDVSLIQKLPYPSGHAIIQRNTKGQNSILLYGGTNRMIRRQDIDHAISSFDRGDYIVLQNEISEMEYIMRAAGEKGLRIVLNPSPLDKMLLQYPLELADFILLNEVEASDLCGAVPEGQLLGRLRARFPQAAIVLTLGKKGVAYIDPTLHAPLTHGIYDVPVVDTTGAGDTFTGYFIASIIRGTDQAEALRIASVASSLAVSRLGAEPSIPTIEEVLSCKLSLID